MLRSKIREIETSLAERELQLMSDKLRQEYDRQLENIRSLKQLYEERARVCAAERENLQRQISIKKDELTAEMEKTKMIEERAQGLDKDLESANIELKAVKEENIEYKYENRQLKEDMDAINQLFSQMLMGFNGENNLNIDRLTKMLEENRTLLNEMTTKESNSDGARLPRLLFDLVEQAGGGNSTSNSCKYNPNATTVGIITPASSSTSASYATESVSVSDVVVVAIQRPSLSEEPLHNGSDVVDSLYSQAEADNDTDVDSATSNARKDEKEIKGCPIKQEIIDKVASAQEIIGNLPKVWKVLMELLSHHKIEKVQFKENGNSEDCYKSIETPNGPKAELSVSKTYIKLKDLILEKKSLQKETNHLKTLNSHLEYRLNEQQKRLSTVSLELTKTWHLVGKMQRQHRQLHTHEQILRYQLQQKRRHLNELKDELEYCRRKWAAAKSKNDESQLQCDDLRKEFAKRKLQDSNDSNNSAESGYSDGIGSDDEDENTVRRCGEKRSMFEHSRRIERVLSVSPVRSMDESYQIRRHSAPPDLCSEKENSPSLLPIPIHTSGAIPKRSNRKIRFRKKDRSEAEEDELNEFTLLDDEDDDGPSTSGLNDRAGRMQRLEDQCKSLIVEVISNSENKEQLEVQLCHFQENQELVAPLEVVELECVQKDGLTDEEIRYTSKRSERLTRLEDESKELIKKLTRNSEKGDEIKKKVDDLHERYTSEEREDSATNTEETTSKNNTSTCLTFDEEAYTRRRAERLQRLEGLSKSLSTQLNKNSERAESITTKLDDLHERYNTDGGEEKIIPSSEDTKEGEATTTKNPSTDDTTCLTFDEEAYTRRRAERLQRLEGLSKSLFEQLNKNTERADSITTKLDDLHTKYSTEHTEKPKTIPQTVACSSIVPEELTESVVITAIPCQVAASSSTPSTPSPTTCKGAVPKTVQLLASKRKERQKDNKEGGSKKKDEESLEEMFLRLSELPCGDTIKKDNDGNDEKTDNEEKKKD
ncbi:hypothetical protein ACFFRR_004597 [Megaselia abdita]